MDRRDYYTVQRCVLTAGAAPRRFSSSSLRVASKAFSRESNSKLKAKRKERKKLSARVLRVDDVSDLDLDPPWSYFDGSSRDQIGFFSLFVFSPRRGSGFVVDVCFVC